MKELTNLKRLMRENGLIASTGNSADNLEIIPFGNLMRRGFTPTGNHNDGDTNVCESCEQSCKDACSAGCKDGCDLGCKDGSLSF